jgi:hypothetical protein
MVSIQSCGIVDSYDGFCDMVYTLFKNVAKSKIVDDEEGSVLYMV